MDDVIFNKIEIIKRCLKRIREEYVNDKEAIDEDFTKQDSVILNLQRACEASIDLGMRLVKNKKLGLPQSSGDVFALLSQEGVIQKELSHRLQKMVGFRNIAVHDYQRINLSILHSILDERLIDFENFIKTVLEKMNEPLT